VSNILTETATGSSADPVAAIRKVTWRLVPFLFILYIVNYLDRINIGFAALSMNRDLHLTATAFGLANTIFYAGYVACEIPSNLLMANFGARLWLSRIMITWGLASAATMLVVDTASLYGVRFLVGVFEAGFAPGVILYLTYWFPESHRARANGWLMMAQPVAMAVGATVSGVILDRTHGLLGLQGWRWMFLLEGAPAVLLGTIAYFYLTDRPDKARWLDNSEGRLLNSMLEADRLPAARAERRPSVLSQVIEAKLLLLAFAYFALVNTLNATATWGPTIVREVMQAYSLTQVGFVTAIAPTCTVVAMPLWVWSSDRHGERILHLSAALMLAALGWVLVVTTAHPIGRMLGLCCVTAGAFSSMAVFWTLPQKLLSPEARPAGIGLISAVGLLGSVVSPAVIGVLRDMTGGFAAGLYYVAVLLVISMILSWIVTVKARPLLRPGQ
jgi:MFS transporter, ACS family, 4-hydroxyphenylacetate permease